MVCRGWCPCLLTAINVKINIVVIIIITVWEENIFIVCLFLCEVNIGPDRVNMTISIGITFCFFWFFFIVGTKEEAYMNNVIMPEEKVITKTIESHLVFINLYIKMARKIDKNRIFMAI